MEEKSLWYRFKNGDDEALSLIYSQYVNELFSYGLRIHGDDQLVKDCIQEVFIHLIDNKRKLHFAELSSAYIFKAFRNQLFEELRTRNNRSNIVKSLSFSETIYSESSEQLTVRSEEEFHRRRILEAALASLSNYQREAIFLKYSQGFGYDKIAEILDVDIASARTLVYRSLKKIKESIFHKILVLLYFPFLKLKH